MNVFNVDRLLCHLQNRDGVAQQLLDGIIPILLVAAAGIALVFAHIDDFQIEIDEVFNLSAAASGTFRLTVEIVEGLLTQKEQIPGPVRLARIIVQMGFRGIFLPGIGFIRFGAEHHAAVTERQEFMCDLVKRSGTFSGTGHAEHDAAGTGVANRPRIAFDI